MAAMGTPKETIQRTIAALNDINNGSVVEHIFIRVHRGLPIRCYRSLGHDVIPVFSWYQAAVILHLSGKLSLEGLEQTATSCALSGQLSDQQLSWLTQDLIRRGLIDHQEYIAALTKSERLHQLIPHIKQAAVDLGTTPTPHTNSKVDYLSFVHDIHEWTPLTR